MTVRSPEGQLVEQPALRVLAALGWNLQRCLDCAPSQFVVRLGVNMSLGTSVPARRSRPR